MLRPRPLVVVISMLSFPLVLIGLLGCLSLIGGFFGAPLLVLVGPLFLYGCQMASGSYPLEPWYPRWAMGSAGVVALFTWLVAMRVGMSGSIAALLAVATIWSTVMLAAGWALDRCRA